MRELSHAFTTATWASLLMALGPAAGRAQEIRIDAAPGHAVHAMRPSEALGAAVDRIPDGMSDKVLTRDMLKTILSSGWQTITYRQNTELHAEAWHWNPQGSWSEAGGRGYFTGNAVPAAAPVLHSYGYPLPRRGVTRDDGTDTVGYSRVTDGDPASFWKSNPYLSHAFTGEDDELHPQWIILDLADRQALTAIRIDWAQPYATHYLVQYWTGDDPIRKPTAGTWQLFPHGEVADGKGGRATVRLADEPVRAQWIRVLMTHSSETCDAGLRGDVRNCLGYAIGEIYLGTLAPDGALRDLVRHTQDQDQTATYCSSVDPWHEARDLDKAAGEQIGFDRFFTSGVTRSLPAMMPIAILYNTPEDAANEMRYLEARRYPVSYVEMGEEADGHYTPPEDYAALYIQFARALHAFDPKLKLGGPIFTGQNEDIETWPDAHGDASWTRRFLLYLKSHGHLDELAFFSFEHYPVDPGKLSWASLYEEPHWVSHILDVWHADGVPRDVPMFITESNFSSQYSEGYLDVWSALWLADYVGSFFSAGGDALYYFHYLPEPMGTGIHGSPGTFGFLSLDGDFHVRQPLAQFYASQLINLEWVEPGAGIHRVHRAQSDVRDEAGHALVTAYPIFRPDGQWSVMIVNKDQDNAQSVRLAFDDEPGAGVKHFAGTIERITYGRAQYQWHAGKDPHADPDDPPVHAQLHAMPDTTFELPAASITVLRGRIE